MQRNKNLSQKGVSRAVGGLKAIAHPARLRILCSLLGGENSVNHLAKTVKQSQSAVSQHLSRMKAAGVLGARREGNQVYYSVAGKGYNDLVQSLCDVYGGGR